MKVKVRKKPARKVELAKQAKKDNAIIISEDVLNELHSRQEEIISSIRQCRCQNQ